MITCVYTHIYIYNIYRFTCICVCTCMSLCRHTHTHAIICLYVCRYAGTYVRSTLADNVLSCDVSMSIVYDYIYTYTHVNKHVFPAFAEFSQGTASSSSAKRITESWCNESRTMSGRRMIGQWNEWNEWNEVKAWFQVVPSGSKWFPILGPTSGNPISGPSPSVLRLHFIPWPNFLVGRWVPQERPTQMFQGSNPFILMCHLVSH